MGMKLWNRTHIKFISFKRIDSKVKLGTLHFNNMINAQSRHEVLEDFHVMDTFTTRDEMQT